MNYRKTIAGPRTDSTEPCSSCRRQCATLARFSEPRDFRVIQHNLPKADVPHFHHANPYEVALAKAPPSLWGDYAAGKVN